MEKRNQTNGLDFRVQITKHKHKHKHNQQQMWSSDMIDVVKKKGLDDNK